MSANANAHDDLLRCRFLGAMYMEFGGLLRFVKSAVSFGLQVNFSFIWDQ